MKSAHWRPLLAALLLAGCSSAPADETAEIVRIAPAVADDPASQLIRLTYTNGTATRLCLNDWPTTGGIIQNNGEQIFLTIAGEKFYLRKEQDNCPRGCVGPELPAGATISGIVFYDLFDLPEHLRSAPKLMPSLTFTAETCPHGRN